MKSAYTPTYDQMRDAVKKRYHSLALELHCVMDEFRMDKTEAIAFMRLARI